MSFYTVEERKLITKVSKIARGIDTSAEELDKLWDSEYKEVRLEVARNKNTSTNTLHKMREDNYWEARLSVIENHNTSQETTNAILGVETDIGVFYGLAYNPDTSPEVLDKIRASESIAVRLQITRNKNSFETTLIQMLEVEKVELVIEQLKKALELRNPTL